RSIQKLEVRTGILRLRKANVHGTGSCLAHEADLQILRSGSGAGPCGSESEPGGGPGTDRREWSRKIHFNQNSLRNLSRNLRRNRAERNERPYSQRTDSPEFGNQYDLSGTECDPGFEC